MAMAAYALVAGLLLGRHSYCHDFSLLLLTYVLLASHPSPIPEGWLRFLCLPFLYLGLIHHNVLSATLPLALLAFLGFLCWRVRPSAASTFSLQPADYSFAWSRAPVAQDYNPAKSSYSINQRTSESYSNSTKPVL